MTKITYYASTKEIYGKTEQFDSFESFCSFLTQKGECVYENKVDNSLFSLCSFQGKRTNTNALATNLFGLDFDYENNSIEKTCEVLNELECKWFLYTTHSHKPDHHKFRVILELSEELQSSFENELLFNHFNQLFRQKDIVLDEQCKNISRIWYLPCSSSINLKCVTISSLNKPAYEITQPLEQELLNKEKWDEYERAQSEKKQLRYAKRKGDKDKAKKKAVQNFQRSHKGVY
ncbi:hypothetical protein [Gluconobacter potus]|uniref:hypothetical protein n=1 Tax=Gluconobacter potus TaxID=2724927 RepID=UPI000B05846F|nr:hypothetical protein [Gluconobacter potus]